MSDERPPTGLTRRQFLRSQLAGSLLLAGTGLGLAWPGSASAQDQPDLVVAKGGPDQATRAAVEVLGGMERFVKPGDKVVIKPNMSFPNPPSAATNTHPEVVAAIMDLCRQAGAQSVLVLDNTLSEPERCLEESGIPALCRVMDPDSVHVLNKSRFFERREIPGAKALTATEVMKSVLEADVLIAAAKAKHHSGAGVSMSMKGMMGLILNRGALHRNGLHQSIVDLNRLLRADLAVVDATTVLTTGGPFGPGEVARKDLVVAGTDPVAVDALTVTLTEYYGQRLAPRNVEHIRLAHEQGLGRMDVENLAVVETTAQG